MTTPAQVRALRAVAREREAEIQRLTKERQTAAGRAAVLSAMLRKYQAANRIHNDYEAALFEEAARVLALPPIPLASPSPTTNEE